MQPGDWGAVINVSRDGSVTLVLWAPTVRPNVEAQDGSAPMAVTWIEHPSSTVVQTIIDNLRWSDRNFPITIMPLLD